MRRMPVLHTKRLLLRGFAQGDLAAVYAIFSDEAVNRFLPWFPLQSRDEAAVFLTERLDIRARSEGAYCYAVCPDGGAPVGYVTISGDDSHDLGYGLLPAYWHKGIATEAAGAVLEQLRRDGAPYVTATHDVNNPHSGAVMRRLGMRYRYTYEEQWMPKNFPVMFRLYQMNFQADSKNVYRKYWDISTVHFVESNL